MFMSHSKSCCKYDTVLFISFAESGGEQTTTTSCNTSSVTCAISVIQTLEQSTNTGLFHSLCTVTVIGLFYPVSMSWDVETHRINTGGLYGQVQHRAYSILGNERQ